MTSTHYPNCADKLLRFAYNMSLFVAILSFLSAALATETAPMKLHPKIRTTPIVNSASRIPLDIIQPFLRETRLVSQEQFQTMPQILSPSNGQVVMGTQSVLYAKGIAQTTPRYKDFAIYREQMRYTDPKTQKLLAIELVQIGKARLIRAGDPAILDVQSAKHEIQASDRLIPSDEDEHPFPVAFETHPPSHLIEGQILNVIGGLSVVGQYDVVAINRGTDAHLRVGDLLSIYKKMAKIKDPTRSDFFGFFPHYLHIPNVEIGKLMIFNTTPTMSYGLTLSATAPIQVNDIVANSE